MKRIKNQLHNGAIYTSVGFAFLAPFVSHYFAGNENFGITILVTLAAGAYLSLVAKVNE